MKKKMYSFFFIILNQLYNIHSLSLNNDTLTLLRGIIPILHI